MTWEDLIKKVKLIISENKIEIYEHHTISIQDDRDEFGICFNENGTVDVCDTGTCHILAKSRTTDQMYQIIKALTEKE